MARALNLTRTGRRFGRSLLPWVLLSGLTLACDRGTGDEKAKDDTQPSATAAVPVEIQSIDRKDIQETLLATATVASRKTVEMVAESQGIVTRSNVEVGDAVEKGQLLLAMQQEEIGLGLQAARSTASRLEREVARMEPLLAKGIVSQQSVDRVRDQLAEARGEVRRVELAAKDLRIRAPFDGVIARASVDVGQQVTLGTPLLSVVDPDDLIIDVPIPEVQLSKVYPGQPATIQSDALPKTTFEGTVERLSPVVDPTTGTIGLRLAIRHVPPQEDQPQMRLRPGMFVKVRIAIQTKENVLVIPRRSVIRRDDVTKVFVMREGLAEERQVQLGILDGSVVEVTEGLNDGDKVIVLGQDGLQNGTAVTVPKETKSSS